MIRLNAIWITGAEAQAVCRMLTDAGYQALFVGGCVRNALLEEPISDIDLTTDAHPEQVVKLAQKAGFKPVPTGIDHGTVTVVVAHHPFEITTFRRDVETDGRRATVAYARTLEEDAHRRDFTMNALYARPDGGVVDPLGGLVDLKARRVRFIDNAEDRIREDYLRILRFFRFHAWYGDPSQGLDRDGLAAVAANSGGLETLSRERVGQELLKLLSAPDPAPSVAAMAQAGILAHVLPGAVSRILPVLIHLEAAAGTAPNPIRRLAALGGDEHQERLRLSKNQSRQLAVLLKNAGKTAGVAEFAYHHGVDAARDLILLNSAVLETDLPENFEKNLAKGASARFPVRPKDLMPGLKGPALGRRLNALEDRWIASGFTLTRQELLE